MSTHYSVDRAVNSKIRGISQNIPRLFVIDVTPPYVGQPYIRSAGYNSDVMVYNAFTGKLLRKETPSGEVIEVYDRTTNQATNY